MLPTIRSIHFFRPRKFDLSMRGSSLLRFVYSSFQSGPITSLNFWSICKEECLKPVSKDKVFINSDVFREERLKNNAYPEFCSKK